MTRCEDCGKHFLIPESAITQALKTKRTIECCSCGSYGSLIPVWKKKARKKRTNEIITYIITPTSIRPQAQGRAPREAIPEEGQVQVRRGLHLLSERRGQVLNTHQIRYKQFPRSRRSIRTLHIEADSLQNARINFLKAINLMKKLQHYTPFWCDHICIVDTWEVASNG